MNKASPFCCGQYIAIACGMSYFTSFNACTHTWRSLNSVKLQILQMVTKKSLHFRDWYNDCYIIMSMNCHVCFEEALFSSANFSLVFFVEALPPWACIGILANRTQHFTEKLRNIPDIAYVTMRCDINIYINILFTSRHTICILMYYKLCSGLMHL